MGLGVCLMVNVFMGVLKMNGNPSKKQKNWHNWLRSRGCSIQGDFNDGRLSIHHIKGSKMKLKGVKNAGEWYCICLSYWWHQDGNNPEARHINKKAFEAGTGKTEKLHWIWAVELYESFHGCKPMSEEEYQIIKDRA